MKTENIKLNKLHPFPNHPYKVSEDEEMSALAQSIKECGVLTPLIARPIDGSDEYEIVSGHRRFRAAQLAGIDELPAAVTPLDRYEAAIVLVDSNLHREHLLPSEKAFAYKLKMEALNHRGITCGQAGHKSRDSVSETESGRTVQRYIRLTYLIPELLNMMDEGKIALSVGVELSYLNDTMQREVLDTCQSLDCTPSYSQSCELRKYANDGRLSGNMIFAVLSREKPNQKERLRIPMERVRKYFPQNYSSAQIENEIVKMCEARYKRRTDRDR